MIGNSSDHLLPPYILFIILAIIIVGIFIVPINSSKKTQDFIEETSKFEILKSSNFVIEDIPIKIYKICLNHKVYMVIKDSDSMGITMIFNEDGKPLNCEFSSGK